MMCVLQLMESGFVFIVTICRVGDTFAAGLKARCDQFCEDLNCPVPVNNLGELRWYALVVDFRGGLRCWYFDDFATSFH